jgi:hypothetical protein
VFTELAIIVVGGFIGLQVNNWNQAGADARLGLLSLNRAVNHSDDRADCDARRLRRCAGSRGLAPAPAIDHEVTSVLARNLVFTHCG